MSARRSARGAWLGAVALALALPACAPDFERIEFENRTALQAGVVLRFEGIAMQEGLAAAALANPIDDSGELMDEETEVRLYARDPGVLGVQPGDIEEPRVFVFFGSKAGSTAVVVEIDGEEAAEIPATVTLQE